MSSGDRELLMLALSKLDKLDEQVGKLREEVAALKVKAGIWGIAGGGLVAILEKIVGK